jgi:hypothetical protein
MVALLVMEAGTSRLSPPLRTGFAQIDTTLGSSPHEVDSSHSSNDGPARVAAGQAVAVMGFTVTGGRIVAIDALADPARLERLDLTILDD